LLHSRRKKRQKKKSGYLGCAGRRLLGLGLGLGLGRKQASLLPREKKLGGLGCHWLWRWRLLLLESLHLLLLQDVRDSLLRELRWERELLRTLLRGDGRLHGVGHRRTRNTGKVGHAEGRSLEGLIGSSCSRETSVRRRSGRQR
jgi:hypothetical protein